MKRTQKLLLMILIISAALLVGCAKEAPKNTTAENLQVFTLVELEAFDGQNGNPAYIAVDGMIYDVSNASPWKNGQHNGFEAGRDLTEEIKNSSPHGVSKLRGLPVVGKLEG